MGVWVLGIEADGGMSNKDGQSFDQLPFNPTWAGVEATDWQGCPIPFVGAVSACPDGGTITAPGVPTIRQKQTMFGYNVGDRCGICARLRLVDQV